MKKKIKRYGYQIFCVLVGLFLMLPLLYAVCISFMEPAEILTKELHFFPNSLSLENYRIVFKQTAIFRFMLNSFLIAFVSSFVRIITSSLSAFSFAFFEYKGKKLMFYLVTVSLIIPVDVLMVQNYFTVADMGMINTYMGMMVVFFVSSMNIFVMRQNFMAYSRTLKEAAMIDGCSNFLFYLRILLPSSKSVLATVFISSFVGTWNTYLWPMMVTNKNEMRTAQVAITMMNVNESSSFGYGSVMAAAVIILIPSILVFIIFQKKIIGGAMAGAVKG